MCFNNYVFMKLVSMKNSLKGFGVGVLLFFVSVLISQDNKNPEGMGLLVLNLVRVSAGIMLSCGVCFFFVSLFKLFWDSISEDEFED